MRNCGRNIALTCGDVFTDDVLAGLGRSPAEIAELRNNGIIA